MCAADDAMQRLPSERPYADADDRVSKLSAHMPGAARSAQPTAALSSLVGRLEALASASPGASRQWRKPSFLYSPGSVHSPGAGYALGYDPGLDLLPPGSPQLERRRLEHVGSGLGSEPGTPGSPWQQRRSMDVVGLGSGLGLELRPPDSPQQERRRVEAARVGLAAAQQRELSAVRRQMGLADPSPSPLSRSASQGAKAPARGDAAPPSAAGERLHLEASFASQLGLHPHQGSALAAQGTNPGLAQRKLTVPPIPDVQLEPATAICHASTLAAGTAAVHADPQESPSLHPDSVPQEEPTAAGTNALPAGCPVLGVHPVQNPGPGLRPGSGPQRHAAPPTSVPAPGSVVLGADPSTSTSPGACPGPSLQRDAALAISILATGKAALEARLAAQQHGASRRIGYCSTRCSLRRNTIRPKTCILATRHSPPHGHGPQTQCSPFVRD